jgi:hypothetical protein
VLETDVEPSGLLCIVSRPRAKQVIASLLSAQLLLVAMMGVLKALRRYFSPERDLDRLVMDKLDRLLLDVRTLKIYQANSALRKA